MSRKAKLVRVGNSNTDFVGGIESKESFAAYFKIEGCPRTLEVLMNPVDGSAICYVLEDGVVWAYSKFCLGFKESPASWDI